MYVQRAEATPSNGGTGNGGRAGVTHDNASNAVSYTPSEFDSILTSGRVTAVEQIQRFRWAVI